MRAGGITQRTGFFLVIWVCITLITSACRASWHLTSPVSGLINTATMPHSLGSFCLLHAMLPCHQHFCSASTHLLPFLSVYHPAAPSIHSSRDFTQHQTFSFCSPQPKALGRFLTTGTTLGSKGTARPGQAGNTIQMGCLVAGKYSFPRTLDTHSRGTSLTCHMSPQGTTLLTAGLHAGPKIWPFSLPMRELYLLPVTAPLLAPPHTHRQGPPHQPLLTLWLLFPNSCLQQKTLPRTAQ